MPRLPVLALLLAACGGPNDADTAADPDTGDPADTDTADIDTGDTDTADTDTDTGDTDTGDTDSAPPPEGLLHTVGSATVLDTFAGTETVLFTDGATELCRVELSLASTGPRDDCDECDWAFDVEVLDAAVVTDVACAAVGWDDLSAVVGTTRAYGFVALYFGHAPVLMTLGDAGWGPAGYAEYDATTGALGYDLDAGYHPY